MPNRNVFIFFIHFFQKYAYITGIFYFPARLFLPVFHLYSICNSKFIVIFCIYSMSFGTALSNGNVLCHYCHFPLSFQIVYAIITPIYDANPTICEYWIGLWECVARNNPQASKSGAFVSDINLLFQFFPLKGVNYEKSRRNTAIR